MTVHFKKSANSSLIINKIYHLLRAMSKFEYVCAHSENRDQRMRQVVAYKRLKTMENH